MQQNNDEKNTSLHVPGRSIPVPQSISLEAQAVLSRAAETPLLWPSYPALDDTNAWLGFVDSANANMKVMLGAVGETGDGTEIEIFRVGESSCYHVISNSAPDSILFEIHGGALVAGAGELCRQWARWASGRFGATVYAPDYRMPPLHPYPVPLDDCVAAYREVLRHHDPARIVVHGSSAGGNLAAALILRANAEGLPLPAGLILETPELDLTESGDSFHTNMVIDVVAQCGLGPVNRLYANGHDLADPLLSPLFGDFSKGCPPTLITAGTRDIFLSNAVRMLHRLRGANVSAELLVYEAMPHGGFFGAPEDSDLAADLYAFAQRCWHRI